MEIKLKAVRNVNIPFTLNLFKIKSDKIGKTAVNAVAIRLASPLAEDSL